MSIGESQLLVCDQRRETDSEHSLAERTAQLPKKL